MPVERGNITKKEYVKVVTSFDATGYMQPKEIIWGDGRTFQIDQVRDFQPAGRHGCDRYTIMLGGRERFLFFERSDPRFAGHFGRWYVEMVAAESERRSRREERSAI